MIGTRPVLAIHDVAILLLDGFFPWLPWHDSGWTLGWEGMREYWAGQGSKERYRVILWTPHRLAIAVSQKGVKLSWEDALADVYETLVPIFRGEGGGLDSHEAKTRSKRTKELNKHKPSTETRTTPSNQTRRQAGGFLFWLNLAAWVWPFNFNLRVRDSKTGWCVAWNYLYK